MTKEELKQQLIAAYNKGTLLTKKHNPYQIGIPWNSFRSVVSYEVAENLFEFITNGIDKVFVYNNSDKRKSKDYFEIELNSSFDIASSGITGHSTIPNVAYDRIVAVLGTNQGWHIFGEDSKKIKNDYSNGKLKNRIELL